MTNAHDRAFRGFIAVEVGDGVKKLLKDFLSQVGPKSSGYRLVSPDLLHITLQFLANDVKESLIQEIARELHLIGARTPSLRLSLGRLGAFPSKSRPRVVFMDIDGEKEALIDLARNVRSSLLHLGFEDYGKFQPHVTLARVKDVPSVSLSDWEKAYDDLYNKAERDLSWVVDQILFMESNLTQRGPIYTPKESIRLRGRGSTCQN